MQTVDAERIRTRLHSCHSTTRSKGDQPSVLFPNGIFIHSVDYHTLVTVPQYLLDAHLTPGIDARFDRFSFWGWTAAAIETIENVLDEDLSLPIEMDPENWDSDFEDDPERYISGVVLSQFDSLQTVLRFSQLYGRLERTVVQSGGQDLPTKTALLADLPRTIDYMAFAILEGMAAAVVGETRSANWGHRVQAFLNVLSDDSRSMFENINYLGTPDGYLPSYGQSIEAQHPDLIELSDFEFSTFFGFLTQYRNRLYHNARGGNIGLYVLTLICAVVWDRLTPHQYQTVREHVLRRLNEDLEGVDSTYNPDSGFEEFCLCTGGKRYLEFYPFSRAELSTSDFDWPL